MLNRIDQRIRQALESCGLPYALVNGGSHIKLMVDGHLAGVVSKGGNQDHRRATLNVVCQIRRISAQLKGSN